MRGKVRADRDHALKKLGFGLEGGILLYLFIELDNEFVNHVFPKNFLFAELLEHHETTALG